MALRGAVITKESSVWHEIALGQGPLNARMRMMSPDAKLQIETGHWSQEEKRSSDGISFQGEIDYFLRIRAEAKVVHAVWVISWKGANPEVQISGEGCNRKLQVNGWGTPIDWNVDFSSGDISMTNPPKPENLSLKSVLE
jgi:hypothetical protein